MARTPGDMRLIEEAIRHAHRRVDTDSIRADNVRGMERADMVNASIAIEVMDILLGLRPSEEEE